MSTQETKNADIEKILEITDSVAVSGTLEELARNTVKKLDENLALFNGATFYVKEEDYVQQLGTAVTRLKINGPRLLRLIPKKLFEIKIPYKKHDNLLHKAIDENRIIYSSSFADVYSPIIPRPLATLIQRVGRSKVIVVIPCSVRGEVQAVLMMGLKSDEVDESQKDLIRVFSSQLGYAIHNFQLLEKLKKEKIEFLSLLSDVLDGMLITHNRKLYFVNSKLSELTEYSQEELFAMKDINEIMAPEEFERVNKYAQARMKGEYAPHIYVSKIKTKSGRIFPAEVRVSPIIYEDKDMFMASIRDISTQEDAISQLKRIYSNQAKVFAEIAHSLNTPLTIINGLIELELKDEKSKERRTFLKNLKSEVDDASEKIRRLMNIAKYDLREYKLKYRKVLANKFMEDVYNKSKALGKKYCNMNHDQNCSCLKLKNNTKAKVEIDPERIADAVNALIENAYKYSTREDEKSDILIQSWNSRSYFYIKVRDKGKGIPKETLKNAFKPFAFTKDSKIHSGTGIGLPMVKQIVDKHQGKLEVNSKLGKGTEFIMELPINKPEKQN